MKQKQNSIIIRERIHEIQQYRKVLSEMLGHRISLDQAIDDWFEHEFHQRPQAIRKTVAL